MFYIAEEGENQETKIMSFVHLFVDIYEMRKRNFDEKLKDVITGNDKRRKYL